MLYYWHPRARTGNPNRVRAVGLTLSNRYDMLSEKLGKHGRLSECCQNVSQCTCWQGKSPTGGLLQKYSFTKVRDHLVQLILLASSGGHKQQQGSLAADVIVLLWSTKFKPWRRRKKHTTPKKTLAH
eukprot:1140631-Pelagomonas_calceolata.AAC.3